MKRLTQCIAGIYKKKCENTTTADIISRFGEYEDTGLKPSQIREILRQLDGLINGSSREEG